jgi:hypothetical protein
MPDGGTAIALPPAARGRPVVRTLAPDQRLMRWTLVLAGVALLLVLAAPMAMLLVRAFQDAEGAWVGIANFTVYCLDVITCNLIGTSQVLILIHYFRLLLCL